MTPTTSAADKARSPRRAADPTALRPRRRRWTAVAPFTRRLTGKAALGRFSRHPLIDAFVGRGPAGPIPDPAAGELLQLARDAPARALLRCDAHADGLNAREAAARLRRDGPNEVEHDRPPPAWRQLWRCYRDPFNLLLSTLAAIAGASGDLKATGIIGTMVLLSTGIRFVQERRSRHAADALRALVGHRTTVWRRPAARGGRAAPPAAPIRTEIATPTLVRGDIVALAAGDMVPADCRLLEARDLFVAQSALTGEALPVEKFAERRTGSTEPLEQANLVFMGTNVISGTGTALVAATGRRSCFGMLAARVMEADPTPNAFQAGVNSVSWMLIRFAAVMVPIVLLVNGFTKGDWLEAALFALSVAVGLTPEMLPMIVTSTLARGAVRLSQRRVIVKRLDAIQNFGAMDVLCTDKTGTLTQDQIALARHIDPAGAPSQEVLACAYLNSFYQTGLRNLLDRALQQGVDPAEGEALRRGTARIDEIPFDFERRRMSVVVRCADGTHRLICKGAVEEVLGACTRLRGHAAGSTESADLPLDAAATGRVQALVADLNREGLRVVAVAAKALATERGACAPADECDLVLLGFVAFLDPPKASAAPALTALAAHGVRVKVLSGDSEAVTRCVCAQVGLPAATALLGSQVAAMDDDALAAAVEHHDVFAKLAPLEKERIVRALRRRRHVVGFLGDGINDAAALRAADVGISVDSAVDIAREAADVILLEKSLTVLDAGVVEGRATFCNMLKYIRMTVSSNFGNVLSVLVASAFLPFLPMLPLQLLTQNLLYDLSQTGIPFDDVDAELVARPLAWNAEGIGRFMVFFGPISSLFDLATFALMWWVFHADTPQRQALFQSGWFVVGLATQTLIVHLIRTPKLPFLQSRPGVGLALMTLGVVAVGVLLPSSPLAPAFGLQALPASYYGWLVVLLGGYGLATSLMKRFYVRRYGWG